VRGVRDVVDKDGREVVWMLGESGGEAGGCSVAARVLSNLDVD
jgi:hypothetical protein